MIGVAGCGRMGGPMLAALRHAGFDAIGFDVAPTQYIHCTDVIATFKNNMETVITVVRDIPQTEDVLFGEQNLVGAPHL